MTRGLVAIGAILVLLAIAVGFLVTRTTGGASLQRQALVLSNVIPGQMIHAIDVDCRIEFAETDPPTLDCACTIDADGNGDRLTLLLNPGLTLTEARIDDTETTFDRNGEVITIQQPPGTTRLALQYRGTLEPGSLHTPYGSHNTLVASYQSFWHPVDLNSFHTFSASIELPEDLTVVCAQAPAITTKEHVRTIRWTEPRPILGASLVVGPFTRIERTHGGTVCAVYAAPGYAESDIDATLDTIGRSYNMLEAILGDDGFRGVALAFVPAQTPFGDLPSANSVFALQGDTTAAPPESIVPMLAANWWGGTITAPWFPSRPNGGPWVNQGLAEYFAWIAMQRLYGPDVVLGAKSTFSNTLSVRRSLRTTTLLENSAGTPNETAIYPYIASMLSAYTGDESFLAAARQILRDYRYRSVAPSEVVNAFAAHSERDLSEFMRVWFDRPGRFDYEIADVTVREDSLDVRIFNRGNNPAYGPIAVLVETNSGHRTHRVTVGARGGEVTLPSSGDVQRVVLDPEWVYPDVNRDNNAWMPRGM